MIAQQVYELMTNGIATKPNIYIGELPTDGDNCLALIEEGGSHDAYFGKQNLNEPYLRVMVRNLNYQDGYTQVNACKKLLTSYATSGLIGIVLKGDILYLGRDDKRRNLFQLTFKIFY